MKWKNQKKIAAGAISYLFCRKSDRIRDTRGLKLLARQRGEVPTHETWNIQFTILVVETCLHDLEISADSVSRGDPNPNLLSSFISCIYKYLLASFRGATEIGFFNTLKYFQASSTVNSALNFNFPSLKHLFRPLQ